MCSERHKVSPVGKATRLLRGTPLLLFRMYKGARFLIYSFRHVHSGCPLARLRRASRNDESAALESVPQRAAHCNARRGPLRATVPSYRTIYRFILSRRETRGGGGYRSAGFCFDLYSSAPTEAGDRWPRRTSDTTRAVAPPVCRVQSCTRSHACVMRGDAENLAEKPGPAQLCLCHFSMSFTVVLTNHFYFVHR